VEVISALEAVVELLGGVESGFLGVSPLHPVTAHDQDRFDRVDDVENALPVTRLSGNFDDRQQAVAERQNLIRRGPRMLEPLNEPMQRDTPFEGFPDQLPRLTD
jgi:hypothetical protein